MGLFLIIGVGYSISHTYPGAGVSTTEAQGLTHAGIFATVLVPPPELRVVLKAP